MEEQELKPKSRRFWIIVGGIIVVLAGVFAWLAREPLPPYAFLTKFPIVEWRDSADKSQKVAILKGSFQDVSDAAEKEATTGMLLTVSNGVSSINGTDSQYKYFQTDTGSIQVSDDLKLKAATPDMEVTVPELKPGYCAVAFTRPKSMLDKAMDWIREHLGSKKEEPPSTGTFRDPAAPLERLSVS